MHPGNIPGSAKGLRIRYKTPKIVSGSSPQDDDFGTTPRAGWFYSNHPTGTIIDYGETLPGWLTWSIVPTLTDIVQAMSVTTSDINFAIFTHLRIIGRNYPYFRVGLVVSNDDTSVQYFNSISTDYSFAWERAAGAYFSSYTYIEGTNLYAGQDLYLRMRRIGSSIWNSYSIDGHVWSGEVSWSGLVFSPAQVGLFALSSSDQYTYNLRPKLSVEFFRYSPDPNAALIFPEPVVGR